MKNMKIRSLTHISLIVIVLLILGTQSIFKITLIPADNTPVGTPENTTRNSETVISVTDDILQNNVTRLGINVGGRSRWGDSITALKNLIPNPGFEAAYMSSNILLRSDRSNSTDMMQDFWEEPWNNDASGAGQPDGFWNEGEYEFVYGNAKGSTGNITKFYFSEDSSNTSRPTFTLDQQVPVPNDHDVMMVRKKFDSNYLLSINSTAASPWSISGDEDIYFDTNENRENTQGEQSIRLGTGTRLDLVMDTYYRDGDITCGKGVIVKGDWNISFWARAEIEGDKIQVRFFRDAVNLIFTSQTITLSTQWRHYSINFSVADGLDEDRNYQQGDTMGALVLRFETQSQGNSGHVWLDDSYLGKRNQTNPTIFSDLVVSHLNDLKPGILRGWYGQLGISLEEFTDPTAGRSNQGYRIGSRKPSSLSYSVHEFFELARAVNASVWLVIPPTLSATELSELIDYLAGPDSTPYGSKRADLGQIKPWTEVFTVRLEFGNELWGSGSGADPFGGASLNGGTRLGSIANDRFAIMRQNVYFDPEKIKLTIGGQSAVPERQNQIEQASNNHDQTAIAGYYYGSIPNYSTIEEIFGSLYAMTTEYRTVGSFGEGIGNIQTGGHEPAIYEINFHTTDLNGPPEDLRNRIVAGQGGGISLSYAMLSYLKYLGIKDQAAFSSWQYSYRYDWAPSQYVKLWGMLRDLDRTKYKRPTWLSVEMANTAIFGDMVATVHGGEDPTWIQNPINGISSQIEIPFIHSFAFRDGDESSMILYNLHRTDELDIRLDLQENPGASAKRYLLASSDIYDDNEGRNENVTIVESDLNDFTFNYSLVLPPHSITVLTWKDNSPPEANFTIAPAFPDVDEIIIFRSTFSDADGAVVNWTWDFGDGSVRAYGRNVTHRYADNGNYTIKLWARDDGGTIISVAKNITVKNSPPLSHTMEDIVDYEDRYLLFSGYGNDTASDRYSLRYRWDFGDGNSTDWENNAIAGHAYPEQGIYRATLSVMDDEGLKATDVMNVTILNHIPSAQIDPLLNNTVIKEDDKFSFHGTGDDSPSDINSLQYRWKFGDGNISDWAADAEMNHSYTLSGNYEITFQVKDNNNDTANASINIIVENVAPSGGFTTKKKFYDEDEQIVIKAENLNDTESDLPLLNVTWLADNVTVGYGRNVSFSVPRAGPVIISINITDDDGAYFRSSERFVIQNIPPEAYFSASAEKVPAGNIIIFDAENTSDSSSDMDSLNYTWSLGDGSIAYGQELDHRFLNEGIFPVKLTVTDDDGESDTYEMVITVENIDPAGDEGTGDKKIGKNMWFAIIFIVIFILILFVGIALFLYYKKREKSSALGRNEEIEEEKVVEDKSEKTENPEKIPVAVKDEYEEGIGEDEMLEKEKGWVKDEGWVKEEEKEEDEDMQGWLEEDGNESMEGWREEDDESMEGWMEEDDDGDMQGWLEEDDESMEGWMEEEDDEDAEGWMGDDDEDTGGWMEDEERGMEAWIEGDFEKEYIEEWTEDNEVEEWF